MPSRNTQKDCKRQETEPTHKLALLRLISSLPKAPQSPDHFAEISFADHSHECALTLHAD